MSAVCLDANGDEFQVGDFAEHVNGELDAREVVGLLENNMIDIFILTAAVQVPAENYVRIRRSS